MSRDLSLAIVALAAVIALAVVATIQPPAAEQIITGIVALGSMAIGRVSGANSTDTTPPLDLGLDADTSDLDGI